MIGEPRERVEQWRAGLDSAGSRIVVSPPDDAATLRMPAAVPDAIVLGAPRTESRAGKVLEALRRDTSALSVVPVVGVVDHGALEDGLRAAIEGAVRCLAEPVDTPELTATLDAVPASGLSQPEQSRLARQRALAMPARIEARGAPSDDDDVRPRLVRLTRLEHSPVRAAEPGPIADARRRLATLTTKQRGLLYRLEAEGGVTAVAARLGRSRANVSAGLRRIVHRLGVRDTGELPDLVVSGALFRATRP